MADAGAIRAGQTYVEISADDTKLKSGLAAAQTRLQNWAKQTTQQAGAMGGGEFMGGEAGVTFQWAQSIARGAGIAVAAHMVGAGMSSLSHIIKGEWEKIDKDIEGIPVLGGAAISLANGFDDLFLGIRAGMKKMRDEALAGLKESQGVLAAAMKGMVLKSEIALVGADPFSKQLMAINEKARRAVEEVRKKNLEGEVTAPGAPGEQGIMLFRMLGLSLPEATKRAGVIFGVEGGTTASPRGDTKRIEELRQKETAEAYAEREGKAGADRLAGIVKVQEAASHAAKGWEDSIFSLTQELAKARGQTDALGVEEAKAKRDLAKELAAGTITADQYREKVSELSQIYDELALAEEGRKQDAALAAQHAVMEVAGRALPEMRAATRGMFGAENAWMLRGASGVQEQQLAEQKQATAHLKKLVDQTRDWGVAEFAP